MATLIQQLEAASRRTIASAGPRYSPALNPNAPNVEIAELVEAVSALVLGSRARERAREHAAALRKMMKDADARLDRLLTGIQTTPGVVADDLEQVADLNSARDVRLHVSTLRRHLRVARQCVERRLETVEARLLVLRDKPADQVVESEKRERDGLQYRARDLRTVWSALRDVEDWVLGPAGQLLADRQSVLLLGPCDCG